MTIDTQLAKVIRKETFLEVEANHLSNSLRRSRRRESLVAAFGREVRLDFVRLVGVFRGSGVERKPEKGRL